MRRTSSPFFSHVLCQWDWSNEQGGVLYCHVEEPDNNKRTVTHQLIITPNYAQDIQPRILPSTLLSKNERQSARLNQGLFTSLTFPMKDQTTTTTVKALWKSLIQPFECPWVKLAIRAESIGGKKKCHERNRHVTGTKREHVCWTEHRENTHNSTYLPPLMRKKCLNRWEQHTTLDRQTVYPNSVNERVRIHTILQVDPLTTAFQPSVIVGSNVSSTAKLSGTPAWDVRQTQEDLRWLNEAIALWHCMLSVLFNESFLIWIA